MSEKDERKEWKPITEAEPPQGLIVHTHIDDGRGVRNETRLKRTGALWFFPDDSMYVYYRPTHFSYVDAPACPRCGQPMTLHPSENFMECLPCHRADMAILSDRIRRDMAELAPAAPPEAGAGKDGQ